MRRPSALFICISAWLCATPGAAFAQADSSSVAEIIFFDVGQGDAVLIRSPEGRVALIDAGPSVEVLAKLRSLGVEAIDIAIATHPHADHIGGMADVIKVLPVRYYMDNGVPQTTGTYDRLLRALQASMIVYLQPVARSIELGSVTLRILPPPTQQESNLNDYSIGVVVEYGGFRALLTGDSEQSELEHFLKLGVPHITVLKVPHHGSVNALSLDFITATRPEVAVISCGLGNQFGHPSAETVAAYRDAGVLLLRTDLDGDVRVTGNQDGRFSVWTEHGGVVFEGVAVADWESVRLPDLVGHSWPQRW